MEDPTLRSNETTMGIGVEPLGSALLFFSTLYLMYAQIQGRLGPSLGIYILLIYPITAKQRRSGEIVSVL